MHFTVTPPVIYGQFSEQTYNLIDCIRCLLAISFGRQLAIYGQFSM